MTNPSDKPLESVFVPVFDEQAAYDLTANLLQIGPRVPSSKDNGTITQQARFYITEKLGILETFSLQNFSQFSKNKRITLFNLIQKFNPNCERRIFLSTHWDSRFEAERDKERPEKPILGADDAGSAVGILLEIAQKLNENPLSNIGVDIVLFDGEDQGVDTVVPHSFGLGSQYWAAEYDESSKLSNYEYGINLNMVGSHDAEFRREFHSQNFAPQLLDYVWSIAAELNYNRFFIDEHADFNVEADHYFINKIAKIPTICIINLKKGGGFADYWHTHADDTMQHISKETLKAVGQTLLTLIYRENAKPLPIPPK